MTGRSERQSRPPREKRKATPQEKSEKAPSTYRQERSALVLFYASKIAAAQISAPKQQLAAIIAAIRAEEKSALSALKARRAFMARARRQKKFAWRIAT